MLVEKIGGAVVYMHKDCECVCHNGPHWGLYDEA